MRPTRSLDALNAPEPFDLCIVGSRGLDSRTILRGTRGANPDPSYVCGSETFGTDGAVSPVLTIAAMAHNLADRLTAALRQR